LGSADINDFLSGCWFAHGSTALLRREAFARVGESDPALRRFEDYDWFVRFALAGGRLEVWPHVAAIVEVSHKPRVSAVEDVVAHLRAKYTDPHGWRPRPSTASRRVSISNSPPACRPTSSGCRRSFTSRDPSGACRARRCTCAACGRNREAMAATFGCT
jgi:hypothetical protein